MAAALHTGFQSLPIVDVSGLYSADPAARQRTADQLGLAARQAGFFYATGHGVSSESSARLLLQAKAFFAQPSAEKMALYIGKSANHRGYVPPGEEVFYGGSRDQKEAFDLCAELPPDDPDVLAGTPLLGPNVWPELPGFRADVSRYYAEVFELGRVLLAGFAVSLGLPASRFEPFITKPPSQLRLLHYPASGAASDATELGIGAHTDYECFTILLPTEAGLQVMNGHGEWIEAPPIAGAFIVNIGDLLEIWSNGELIATSHRVRRVQQERYSFPLFFACDYHTRVAPLPELVSESRPAAYAAVIAGEHLFAQTAQSFTYLKQRLARGELALPGDAHPLSSFGQEARKSPAERRPRTQP